MEKELPGPILRTNEEVVHAMHDMDEIDEQYKQRYAGILRPFLLCR